MYLISITQDMNQMTLSGLPIILPSVYLQVLANVVLNIDDRIQNA